MVDIVSVYASNIGQLVVNLTNRGYMLRLQAEKNLFDNSVLYLQVSDMKTSKTIKHALSEAEVTAIQDVGIIADAIAERLRKS